MVYKLDFLVDHVEDVRLDHILFSLSGRHFEMYPLNQRVEKHLTHDGLYHICITGCIRNFNFSTYFLKNADIESVAVSGVSGRYLDLAVVHIARLELDNLYVYHKHLAYSLT